MASDIDNVTLRHHPTDDIAEVTRLEHGGASLRDIYAWIGVKIDTYGNFLTLPSDQRDEDGTPGATGKQVEIAKLKPEQKMKLRGENAPSPFVKNADHNPGISKWCLVSLIDSMNALEAANPDSVPAARH
ncbi:hypothetical protein CLCR_03186 [Cladophialophora carrionii]|uniref:Uncharacterized protein n=1 Tax=Cladophialophora carrionii TaxID=86049 RepID=A0A1C1D343_9EURO|nr:hypothetical protein CLCR_03186 [Cladophialophora carrionii]